MYYMCLVAFGREVTNARIAYLLYARTYDRVDTVHAVRKLD